MKKIFQSRDKNTYIKALAIGVLLCTMATLIVYSYALYIVLVTTKALYEFQAEVLSWALFCFVALITAIVLFIGFLFIQRKNWNQVAKMEYIEMRQFLCRLILFLNPIGIPFLILLWIQLLTRDARIMHQKSKV